MGIQSSYCCDHNAEFDMFNSHKQATICSQLEKQIFKGKNQRLKRALPNDNISIIDQLDIRSEAHKEDLARSSELTRATTTYLEAKQNKRPEKIFVESNELKRERQWYEYKFKELQIDKQKQRELIRKQLQQVRNNHKQKKTLRRQKAQSLSNNKLDFQFIVNYR